MEQLRPENRAVGGGCRLPGRILGFPNNSGSFNHLRVINCSVLTLGVARNGLRVAAARGRGRNRAFSRALSAPASDQRGHGASTQGSAAFPCCRREVWRKLFYFLVVLEGVCWTGFGSIRFFLFPCLSGGGLGSPEGAPLPAAASPRHVLRFWDQPQGSRRNVSGGQSLGPKTNVGQEAKIDGKLGQEAKIDGKS